MIIYLVLIGTVLLSGSMIFVIPRSEDQKVLRDLIGRHVEWTGSVHARRILDNWQEMSGKFVKVMPRDYRRVLAAQAVAKAEGREPTWSELLGVKHG